eukprot:109567-Chlamydomonas_euryale.AAC.2
MCTRTAGEHVGRRSMPIALDRSCDPSRCSRHAGINTAVLQTSSLGELLHRAIAAAPASAAAAAASASAANVVASRAVLLGRSASTGSREGDADSASTQPSRAGGLKGVGVGWGVVWTLRVLGQTWADVWESWAGGVQTTNVLRQILAKVWEGSAESMSMQHSKAGAREWCERRRPKVWCERRRRKA